MSLQPSEPTIGSVQDRIRARLHELDAQTLPVRVFGAHYSAEEVCHFFSAEEIELAPQAAISLFRSGELDLLSTSTLTLSDVGIAHLANEFSLGHRDIMTERWGLTLRGSIVYPQSERNRNNLNPIMLTPSLWPPDPLNNPVIPGGQTNNDYRELSPLSPPTKKEKQNNWLWIIIVFVILVIAGMFLSSVTGGDEATPTASRQQLIGATADPQCATRGRIIKNQLVQMCSNGQLVLILENSLTSARRLHQLQTGETATIVGGPACPDGATWWQISTSNKITGWVDEGDEQVGFYICPVNN